MKLVGPKMVELLAVRRLLPLNPLTLRRKPMLIGQVWLTASLPTTQVKMMTVLWKVMLRLLKLQLWLRRQLRRPLLWLKRPR